MAGGNGKFYKEQSIDAGKGIRIRGPLELGKDQTLSKMYVWLWQAHGDGTGAVAIGSLDEDDFNSEAARAGHGEWETRANAIHGELRTGPATGMALAILKRADGSTIPYWWSESDIRLKEGLTDRSALTTQLAEAFQAVADTLKRL